MGGYISHDLFLLALPKGKDSRSRLCPDQHIPTQPDLVMHPLGIVSLPSSEVYQHWPSSCVPNHSSLPHASAHQS